MISAEYLAGFFDGEGYAYAYRAKKGQFLLMVGIVNTHFNVLKSLQDQFGGNLYPKKRRSEKHSQGWELRWYGEEGKAVLLYMLPSLIVKKAEISYLIDNWYKLIKVRGVKGQILTSNEIAERDAVIAQYKAVRASERKVNQHELIN